MCVRTGAPAGLRIRRGRPTGAPCRAGAPSASDAPLIERCCQPGRRGRFAHLRKAAPRWCFSRSYEIMSLPLMFSPTVSRLAVCRSHAGGDLGANVHLLPCAGASAASRQVMVGSRTQDTTASAGQCSASADQRSASGGDRIPADQIRSSSQHAAIHRALMTGWEIINVNIYHTAIIQPPMDQMSPCQTFENMLLHKKYINNTCTLHTDVT